MPEAVGPRWTPVNCNALSGASFVLANNAFMVPTTPRIETGIFGKEEPEPRIQQSNSAEDDQGQICGPDEAWKRLANGPQDKKGRTQRRQGIRGRLQGHVTPELWR